MRPGSLVGEWGWVLAEVKDRLTWPVLYFTKLTPSKNRGNQKGGMRLGVAEWVEIRWASCKSIRLSVHLVLHLTALTARA